MKQFNTKIYYKNLLYTSIHNDYINDTDMQFGRTLKTKVNMFNFICSFEAEVVTPPVAIN